MRIAIGCDHLGFPHKASMVAALEDDEHAVLDLGTHGTDPVEYPMLARAVATAIGNGFVDIGVLLCGSSTGGSIAANKFKGIRAAACPNAETARSGRQHEDLNLICLDATKLTADTALGIVREWLGAQFSGDDRDRRAIARIGEIEEAARHATHHPPGAESRNVRAATAAARSAPAAPRASQPEPKVEVEPPKPPSFAAVEAFIASMKDGDVRTMAGRILEFVRGRFPTATGSPNNDGFSITVNGEHAASVTVGKGFVQVEAGPDHIPTSRIRDVEGLDVALNLPSILRALDAIKS